MPVDRYWLVLGGEAAGLATAIAALAGVPLGWILQNRQFAGKRTVSTIANAALILPAPLLCYVLLGKRGLAGMTASGVLSGLPFLLWRMRTCFAAVPPPYGKAARSLGASEWQVFARVELPLVWRPLATAAAWTLARLLLELAAARWIAELRA